MMLEIFRIMNVVTFGVGNGGLQRIMSFAHIATLLGFDDILNALPYEYCGPPM